ncbi:MAG: GNAT family N-acetyltransferase [Streptosporangiales bacterium]|nr:GNAT family N-acetyltransferase [Streptosporangiales bacterium]
MTASDLPRIIADVERGRFPAADGSVSVVAPVNARDAGVLAFTAHAMVVADVDAGWVAEQLRTVDLSAPLGPSFVLALATRIGRRIGSTDAVLLAEPLPYAETSLVELGLDEIETSDHPRLRRALRHRDGVWMWTGGGAVLAIGRGVGGRYEVNVELDPAARGRGLARALVHAARALVPDGRSLWAQVAPGNAASMRTFLDAGYRPVGAEVLLTGAG